MTKSYSYYADIIKNEHLPSAILDLDLLNENLEALLKRSGNCRIRIASKSIRSVQVLKYIFSYSNQFKSIMCFTLEELIFLANEGFDDLLLAYPDFQVKDLDTVAELIKKGKKITLMVDLESHLQILEKYAQKHGILFSICLDVDMSSTIFGLYFGVYRSSIKTIHDAEKFIMQLQKYPFLKLIGIMGYEAQIAGVGDNIKNDFFKNKVVQFLKKKSIKELAKRRYDIVKLIESKLGYTLELVNGGGTGSIESTIKESVITEVTIGSGIYSSHLFDNYKQFKYKPALFYALQITRQPTSKIFVAHGGGYTASGSIEKNKAPLPYLPKEIQLIKNEGVGEVQTPFLYSGTEKLNIGSPVFFRHAKAGELCERFNSLLIISNGKIINTFKTYRGEGKCFL